jgi:hypothetical protein
MSVLIRYIFALYSSCTVFSMVSLTSKEAYIYLTFSFSKVISSSRATLLGL